ncbi:MAG: hypothetical protein ACRCVV_13685 [Shewanella sp.]
MPFHLKAGDGDFLLIKEPGSFTYETRMRIAGDLFCTALPRLLPNLPLHSGDPNHCNMNIVMGDVALPSTSVAVYWCYYSNFNVSCCPTSMSQ